MSDDKKEVEKPQIGKTAINIIRGKPLVAILIIVAISLAAILIYMALLYTSQSYKIVHYNALWNNSLTDLRNGTVSVAEYCNQEVHDQQLCDQYWNLKYRD